MAKANLVIVESPAKAKTIGKYLGPTYQVLASMGHVRDLPKSKMGVDLETGEFEPQYQPIKGKEDVFIGWIIFIPIWNADDGKWS